MNKFFTFIHSEAGGRTATVIGIFGVLLTALVISIRNLFFSNNIETQYILSAIVALILFMSSGIIGFVYVIRGEINTLFVVKGKRARVFGILLILISIYFIFDTFVKIIAPSVRVLVEK